MVTSSSLETRGPPLLPSTSTEILHSSEEIVSDGVVSSSPPQSHSTRLMTLQESSEAQTSIPSVQTESDGNFQKESSFGK